MKMRKIFTGLLVMAMGSTIFAGCAKENEGTQCMPVVEVCDGIDNDCNGEVDEGNVCAVPKLAILIQPAGFVKGRVDVFDLKQNLIQPDLLTTGVIPNQLIRDGDYFYIINSSDASLQRIDKTTFKTERWYYLPQGSNPWSVAIYNSRKAFVSGWLSNTVEVIDLETGYIKSIPLPPPDTGMQAYPLALTISGSRVYVAESANDGGWPSNYKPMGAYAVIDAESETLISTEHSGVNECINVQQVLVDENNRTFIVCAGDFGTTQTGRIVVKDSSENVIANIGIGNAPTKLYFSSGKGYLTDMFGADIMVIDAQSLAALRDGTNPVKLKESGFSTSIAFTTAGILYATVWDSGNNTNLFALNPETLEVISGYDLSGPAQDVVYVE